MAGSSDDDLKKKIKGIEEQFLKELYNLNVEDLEKVATIKDTEKIDDSILGRFENTYNILDTAYKNDLESIYKELQAQASSSASSSSTSSSSSSPSPSPSPSSLSSTSSVSSSSSSSSSAVSPPPSPPPSSLSSSSSSSSSLSSSAVSSRAPSPVNIQEGLKKVATDKVITSVVENNLQNTAISSVNDTVSNSSIQDNIKDIATNTLSEVVKTNVESIATNTVKKSVGQKEEEEEEENTIEDQIKNSALEAVRYNIELEKEKSYARAYPRKQVGVSNPRNACYAIASIQMLYSLPFLRKYYTELKEKNFDDMQYDFKRTLKLHDPPDKYDNDLINARNHLSGITIFFKNMNVATKPTLVGKCSLITNDTQNQHDVNEYLVSMRSIYIYNDAFRIFSYQELTCENKKQVRVPENNNEEFLSLEITLKKETEETKKKDLNNCIELFNNDNEYGNSEKCINNDNNDKVNNAKRFYIIPPENRYLLILLKRFSYDEQSSKITDYVEPNKILIIGGVKYTLSGVIVHSESTIQSGHYIFIQCDKDGAFTTIYNDSSVTTFDEKEPYNTDFINQNGYVFTYTRYPVDQPT
jgi:hypothetical protein